MGRISIGKQVMGLSRQVVRLRNQCIKECGSIVSAPQLHLFMFFMRNPGCSEKQAAHAVDSDKTFVAKAVKKLKEQRLMISKRDHKDVRVRRIYPTPEAHSEMEKVQQALEMITQIMGDGIGQQRIDAFLETLDTMQNNIKNHIERR